VTSEGSERDPASVREVPGAPEGRGGAFGAAPAAGPPPARLPFLCPACGGGLAGRIADPGIDCGACGHRVPVVRGIPRFVDSEAYTGSFGFEWTVHDRTQLDDAATRESEETFRRYTGLAPEDLRGRRVLDVGCGMGRFADVASRWGAAVLAVDLSRAVESARANLAGRPDVTVAQADLFRLPLADGSFDLVYSLGVLHHTPDCERAFRGLVRLVKPGGRIAIWVYGHLGPWTVFSDFYRRITTRMPCRLLWLLCHAAVPLYHVNRIPLVGWASRMVLPISHHPRASWRVLDTFDWYSPRFQSRHTYPEVYRWFREERLEDVQLHPTPVSVSGRRPLGL
jgi:SAM-dependent methyltransferase